MTDMEVYRNSETTVRLPAPFDTATYTYTVSSEHKEGVSASFPANYNAEDKTISVRIPFEYTLLDGEVTIKIEMSRTDGLGGTYSIEEVVDVVTPLFTFRDIDGTGYNAEQVPELERLVRHVVEAFTGQYFGVRYERHVASYNSAGINFNVPLIELQTVEEGRNLNHSTTLNPPKMHYEVFNDGYSLAIDWDRYDIKTDSMWILNQRRSGCYTIGGKFGYNRVPADIKEAALLIAGMWGCDQAVWRDRYIQTMRSADWSVGYNEKGFGWTTGSVTADMLLSKYVRRNMPEVI